MPKMAGEELLEKIRTNHLFKDIVVCIMTSTIGDEEGLNLNLIPATFFILKPVDTDKFITMIKQAVTYLPEDIRGLPESC